VSATAHAELDVAALHDTGVAPPVIRRLGRVDYEPTWRAMQRFTDQRGPQTPDEIWFLEHPPVFTLGMNASPAHLLAPGDIPVVQIDRGGQVTYPGIYVGAKKLGSVGIRVRRGSSYHGLAVNVSLDLEPFHRINPCGYQGLEMTQFSELGGPASVDAATDAFEPHLLRALGFVDATRS
jgi:lipoyl(octanoyl) transferase